MAAPARLAHRVTGDNGKIIAAQPIGEVDTLKNWTRRPFGLGVKSIRGDAGILKEIQRDIFVCAKPDLERDCVIGRALNSFFRICGLPTGNRALNKANRVRVCGVSPKIFINGGVNPIVCLKVDTLLCNMHLKKKSRQLFFCVNGIATGMA